MGALAVTAPSFGTRHSGQLQSNNFNELFLSSAGCRKRTMVGDINFPSSSLSLCLYGHRLKEDKNAQEHSPRPALQPASVSHIPDPNALSRPNGRATDVPEFVRQLLARVGHTSGPLQANLAKSTSLEKFATRPGACRFALGLLFVAVYGLVLAQQWCNPWHATIVNGYVALCEGAECPRRTPRAMRRSRRSTHGLRLVRPRRGIQALPMPERRT